MIGSVRSRLWERLGLSSLPEQRSRPLSVPVLLVAGLTTIVGTAVALAIAPLAWAMDLGRNVDAGNALMHGSFGTVAGYLYTPLAAAFAIPLALIPLPVATACWFGAGVSMIAAGARHETRSWNVADRCAAGLAAVTFVPVVHDLVLGNVSILLTAAIAAAFWSRDRVIAGIPLGLILATVPKPQLIPVLAWMLVFRRRSLAGTLSAALAATGVGILLLGLGSYRTFIDHILDVPYLRTSMSGNLGLTSLPPSLYLPLASATILVTIVAFRRDETAGFVCAVAAGILLAPYSMAYSAVPLLLAARPLTRAVPRAAFVLAISAPIGVIAFMPLWLGAVMAAALAMRSDAGDADLVATGSAGT